MNENKINLNETPDWIKDMQQHYYKTGTYKPEHLSKFLGDASKSTRFSSKPVTLKDLFPRKPDTEPDTEPEFEDENPIDDDGFPIDEGE